MFAVNITGQRRAPKSECKQFDEQLGLFGNYSRAGVRETAQAGKPSLLSRYDRSTSGLDMRRLIKVLGHFSLKK